jgi:hypothetical protein
MSLWTPKRVTFSPDLRSRLAGGPDRPVNRRRFLKQAALMGGGLFILPDALRSVLDRSSGLTSPKARAGALGATGAEGYVFDVYTLDPLPGIQVTLNGTQFVTGADGHYLVGDVSSVSDPTLVPAQIPTRRSSGGFGCAHDDGPTAPEAGQGIAYGISRGVTTYQPNMLYFEDPTGTHWSASHDVSAATGVGAGTEGRGGSTSVDFSMVS